MNKKTTNLASMSDASRDQDIFHRLLTPENQAPPAVKIESGAGKTWLRRELESLEEEYASVPPIHWAEALTRWAMQLWDSDAEDRETNLQKAIACYQSASLVYTEADFPQDWAKIQNALGVAYRHLSSGNKVANLQKSLSYFDLALRVQNIEHFPQKYAMTQCNRALVYKILGDWNQALWCIEEAIKGHRQVAHEHYLVDAEELKRSIEDAMAAEEEPDEA